jgi:hypothetical protein
VGAGLVLVTGSVVRDGMGLEACHTFAVAARLGDGTV